MCANLSNDSGGLPSSIGRYRVTGRIAVGVTSVVYTVVDDAMGRRAAVKMLQPSLRTPDIERLARGFKAVAQLVHPNVVTVFDMGEHAGLPYIVMELLRGVPLLRYLQQAEPIGLDERLSLVRQVCSGLQAGHERSVTHGGLEPRRVFVEPDGTVKLLGFGEAGLREDDTFTAPERVAGGPATVQADVFSAAAVGYTILTGQVPTGRAGRDDVPDAIDAVLRKALAARPGLRHRSVAHLSAEIEQVRLMRDGERRHIIAGALDRYCRTQALIDERRALGRRLKMADIDGVCRRASAALARRFPTFARSGLDSGLVPPLDLDGAASALAELQTLYNEALAAVSVLRVAAGEPGGDQLLTARATTRLKGLRPGADRTEGSR